MKKQIKQGQRKTFATKINHSKVICASQRQLPKICQNETIKESGRFRRRFIQGSFH